MYYLSPLPLYILILAVPMGVALQACLGFSTLLVLLRRSFKRIGGSLSALQIKVVICGSAFLLWSLIATLIYYPEHIVEGYYYVAGYLFWLLMPPALVLGIKKVTFNNILKLEQWLQVILILWGLIALSQLLFGWGLKGISVISTENRARGLYSHPLSFAYAALFFWPYTIVRFLRSPGKILSVLAFLALITIIIATKSRIVQGFGFLFLVWNIFFVLQKKWRLLVVLCLVMTTSSVLLTNNFVSKRIFATFSGNLGDRFSNYPLDRFAFWHAHLNMLAEKPLVGHGVGRNEVYRVPYYKAIGLDNFPKNYPAHNMFLQVAVDQGCIGLGLFCLWLLLLGCLLYKQIQQYYIRLVSMQTLLLFMLAGLTQNAFHDSCVRFVFTLFISAIFIFSSKGQIQKSVSIN